MTMQKPRRLFRRRRKLPKAKGVVFVIGLIAVLAACAPRSAEWTAAEAPTRLTVDRAEFHHVIRFDEAAAKLGRAEAARLDRFLDRQAVEWGVRVRVAGGATLLDVRRQAAVLEHLRKRGIAGALGSGMPENAVEAVEDESVRLTLVRHVVSLPRCGDWSKPADADRANQTSSNFGCASAANLGLMVADPGVLLRGVELGPGDGDALARGVKAYREGKEETGPTITPLVIESGTRGGAQ